MLLEGEANPEDQQLHKALLSSTIGTGERLLIEAADTETLAPFNLNAAVIAAKIESLRITFDQWHTETDLQQQLQAESRRRSV